MGSGSLFQDEVDVNLFEHLGARGGSLALWVFGLDWVSHRGLCNAILVRRGNNTKKQNITIGQLIAATTEYSYLFVGVV